MDKQRKTLQANVFERFLSPSEYESLLKKYDENKQSMGNKSRFESLEKEVSSDEVALLKTYFDKSVKSMREIADQKGITVSTLGGRVKAIAMRYLYQKGL